MVAHRLFSVSDHDHGALTTLQANGYWADLGQMRIRKDEGH
jgi:hypothetical protein